MSRYDADVAGMNLEANKQTKAQLTPTESVKVPVSSPPTKAKPQPKPTESVKSSPPTKAKAKAKAKTKVTPRPQDDQVLMRQPTEADLNYTFEREVQTFHQMQRMGQFAPGDHVVIHDKVLLYAGPDQQQAYLASLQYPYRSLYRVVGSDGCTSTSGGTSGSSTSGSSTSNVGSTNTSNDSTAAPAQAPPVSEGHSADPTQQGLRVPPHSCWTCLSPRERDSYGWYCPNCVGVSPCQTCQAPKRGNKHWCRPCTLSYQAERTQAHAARVQARIQGATDPGQHQSSHRARRACRRCQKPLHPDGYCKKCDADRLKPCDWGPECQRQTTRGSFGDGYYCPEHYELTRQYIVRRPRS